MSSLLKAFTSKKNVDLVVDFTLENIYEKSGIIVEKDSDFFDIYNNIASKVFNFEKDSKNLGEINNLVVNEITRYVLSKGQNLTQGQIVEQSQDQVREIVKTQDASTNTQNFELCTKVKNFILDNGLSLAVDLQNVCKLKIDSLLIHKDPYNIRLDNNKLYGLDSSILIELKEGYYKDSEDLLSCLNNNSSGLYFEIDQRNYRIIIKYTEKLEIDVLKSQGLLKVLGFDLSQVLSGENEYTSRHIINLETFDKNTIELYINEIGRAHV